MNLEQTVRRVRAEFVEMPGLVLSPAQAQRLWGLDSLTCQHVIAALVAGGFLRQTHAGAICRAE